VTRAQRIQSVIYHPIMPAWLNSPSSAMMRATSTGEINPIAQQGLK